MAILDTWQYGSLYVDAALTIDRLEEAGEFTEQQRDALRAFEESGADFTFDPDYHAFAGGFYSGDQLPMVLIGGFGGYPGDSIDRANCDAAKEWAGSRYEIHVTSSWFGGCEIVGLWYDLSSPDVSRESAQEAVELAEGFKDYPVLDEELWSRYKSMAWDNMIEEMISDSEEATAEMRPDTFREFTEEQRNWIYTLTSEWYGYWEEGYFPEDEWEKILDKVLSGDVQLHQDDKLI